MLYYVMLDLLLLTGSYGKLAAIQLPAEDARAMASAPITVPATKKFAWNSAQLTQAIVVFHCHEMSSQPVEGSNGATMHLYGCDGMEGK